MRSSRQPQPNYDSTQSFKEHPMQKVRLCLDVEYDPAFGSAENLAAWFDNLLKGAICDDHTCDHSMMESFGQPAIGHIRVDEGQTLAIIVEGGMVQSVLTDDPLLPLDVLIVDHDTECVDECDLSTIDFPDEDGLGGFIENVVILRGEHVFHDPSSMDAIKKARAAQVAAWTEEEHDEED